jgi:GNAT superfamily N-acetyltransferase
MVHLVERSPTPDEFAALRASIGWHPLPADTVAAGLPNALYAVVAESEGRVVGCARVVGDGALYFYLQDVMVAADHQKRGIGAAMMEAILAYLRRSAREGSFIGLMAAWHARPFYERYGFTVREEGRPGMQRRWTRADTDQGRGA